MTHPAVIDDVARVSRLFDFPAGADMARVVDEMLIEAGNRREWAKSYPQHRSEYLREAAAWQAAADLLRGAVA